MRKLIVVYYFFISGLFYSCTKNSEVYVTSQNRHYPNGKYIEVEKTTTISKIIGFITGHNYGVSRKFQYNFSVDTDDVLWNGRSREPKDILFCNDSVFVHFAEKTRIQTTVKTRDSLGSPLLYNYKDTLRNGYEVYVDKRYFFKLFGNDYWSKIPVDHYLIRKNICKEYDIPNDNELKLYK